jgi:imidazolonepropionase-like amidohydrolase
VPADVFGLRDRGRLAPGQRADLLLVAGDPLDDVTATRDVRAVWRSGVRV